MGFEHLVASVGATLYMRHKEKKKLQRQMLQENPWVKAREHIETTYNLARQKDLAQMAQSCLMEDRNMFARILGRPYEKGALSLERALRAIADKEGWQYYDENLLIFDAAYCQILGWPQPSLDMRLQYGRQRMKDRQNETLWQNWVKNNPACFAVNLSPETFATEEDFAAAVRERVEKRHP